MGRSEEKLATTIFISSLPMTPRSRETLQLMITWTCCEIDPSACPERDPLGQQVLIKKQHPIYILATRKLLDVVRTRLIRISCTQQIRI